MHEKEGKFTESVGNLSNKLALTDTYLSPTDEDDFADITCQVLLPENIEAPG